MKKKILFAALAGVVFASFWSCSKDNGGPDPTIPGNIGMISDASFANGIIIRDPSSASIAETGYLGFGRPRTVHPSWVLTQWASRFDIASTPLREGEEGEFSYSNKGKKITRYSDGSVELEIRTQSEYDAPRKEEQEYPRLYLGQSFSETVQRLPLSSYDKLTFRMQGCLSYATNFMGGDYDSKLHTCRMVMTVNVSNTEAVSEAQAGFILNIPIYDYRYQYPPEVNTLEAIETGGGDDDDEGGSQPAEPVRELIYGWSGDKVWSKPFAAGEWNSTEVDLLPMITTALEYLQESESWQNVELGDLVLTDFVIGWESPGTFNASFRIGSLGLDIQTK